MSEEEVDKKNKHKQIVSDISILLFIMLIPIYLDVLALVVFFMFGSFLISSVIMFFAIVCYYYIYFVV